MVSVNPVSSFKQIWLCLSTQCCIQSFKVLSLFVPKKKIFKGFYHIWTLWPSWSCDINQLFSLSFPHHMEASIGIWVSKEKTFENVEFEWQRSSNDLDLYILKLLDSCTHLVDCIFQIDRLTDYKSFWKIHRFTFFPIQKQKGPNLTLRKTGQGQPMVVIWTNFVVLENPMLHTKFQGHRLFGSREDF